MSTQSDSVQQISEKELEFLQEKTGVIILEAAVGRLLLSLDERAVIDTQNYLESVSENDDVFEHLSRTYPAFSTILAEEAEALQKEGEKIAK